MKHKRKIDPKTGKGTRSSLPYVDELCELKRRSGKSWRKIAEEVGTHAPSLTTYRDGTYKGDAERMAEKIRDYLYLHSQRSRALLIPYVETSITRSIQEICAFAHLEGTIGVVYGPAGIGKTVSLDDYCRRHDRAYLVTCSPAVRTPPALVREIVLAATESRASKPLWHNAHFLVEHLYGTGALVAIDEAQHLNYEALEQARAVHDAAGAAIVFCGTAVLYDNLTRHRDTVLEQLFSRIGCQRCISDEVPPADVVAVVEAAIGKAATARVKKYLIERSALGGLRTVTRQLRNAAQMAKLADEELSLEHIEEAEKLLMV